MPGPQEYDVPAGMTFDVFKAEYHKLKVQAASQNYTGKPYTLDRRIRHTIKICWGHKCHACKRIIDLKFNVDPVYRQLSRSDAAISQQGEDMPLEKVSAAFHSKCFKDYKKTKAKERRRERYAERLEKYESDSSADVEVLGTSADSPQSGQSPRKKAKGYKPTCDVGAEEI